MSTEIPEELREATVQGFLDDDQWGWDEVILNDICNERDRDLIKQIPLSERRREDTWFWFFDEKERFTVRSCYQNLRGESDCPNGFI